MKSKLTPFDGELLAMIADIMKSEPTVEEKPTMYTIIVPIGSNSTDTVRAMQNAVRGRLGKRLIKFEYFDYCKRFYVAYMDDAESMPDEIYTEYAAPDATAGTRYCRTFKVVDAIQVDRDNLDALKRFTGGGTMTIPRKPGGIAKYSFPSENGVMIDAPETWVIIRESNGRFSIMSKQDFDRDYIRNVGNNDENPVPLSGAEFMQTFNRLFGTDIYSRNRKLTEEYGEYMEAANAFIRNPDDRELYDAMVDELSDLSAVVFHIAGIIGKRPYVLLRSAYDKVIGRQSDPNYRRAHPHKTRCSEYSNKQCKGYTPQNNKIERHGRYFAPDCEFKIYEANDNMGWYACVEIGNCFYQTEAYTDKQKAIDEQRGFLLEIKEQIEKYLSTYDSKKQIER